MTNRLFPRLGAAGVLAALATVLLVGPVLGQEGCSITVAPSSVAVGQQFTVSGNFGGAQVFLVRGMNASPAEGAAPDATTPAGGSFTVTFTAEAGDEGTWTVWGLIPASECGASAALTITAGTVPNTAMEPTTWRPGPNAAWLLGIAALIGAGALIGGRIGRPR
jgi:hypothetical protein